MNTATVKSIATMLGWINVPPQRTLEMSISALKARAAHAVEGSAGSVTLSATDARALAFLLARAIRDDADASDDDRREARKLLDKLGGDTQ